ncbi:hypothetical protein GCM10011351_29410 [Paraliobacillus quinghaiensis]|uniref:Uncharacterized protein n=1 Tax=Paraliobacillus quinghaiensis TaxID=470815 RepID=A0A917TWG4_9BACI|nr:hypothetical protein [Paraliobacillus quinghaiensis]GGM41358.1 hypothetical protein GCM10011351_29410 [Paraliobacillus quinghaiensis]
MRKVVIFIACLVLIAISIYIYNYWANYQASYEEKTIIEAIDIKNEDITALVFMSSDKSTWEVQDKETINNFLKFLDEYKVKKMKVSGYNWQDENISISLITKDESYSIKVEEAVVRVNKGDFNKGHYEVLNSPIDIEKIKHF